MLVPNTLASGLTSSDGSLTQSLRDTAASRVGPFTFYFSIDVVIKEKHCMFCENLNTVSLLLGPTSAFTVRMMKEISLNCFGSLSKNTYPLMPPRGIVTTPLIDLGDPR